MSRIYAQQKRPGAKSAATAYEAPAVHTPSLVSGESNSNLDSIMQAKFQQHFLNNQIPTAEAEAERIAASVSGARTAEDVKSQLGEKMGADFSNVTFHTDSAARGMADTMGARAYTSGSDVYFGTGGFDPGVAAHELVHTVQQGMVDSAMQTTSAPAGGVQMKPGLLSRIGNRIKQSWHNPTSRLHPVTRHYEAKAALGNRNAEGYANLTQQADALGIPQDMVDTIHAKNKFKFSLNPFKRHRQVNEALDWQRQQNHPQPQAIPIPAPAPEEDYDSFDDRDLLNEENDSFDEELIL